MPLLHDLRQLELWFTEAVRTGQDAEVIWTRVRSFTDSHSIVGHAIDASLTASESEEVDRILRRLAAVSNGLGQFTSFSTRFVRERQEAVRPTLASMGAAAFVDPGSQTLEKTQTLSEKDQPGEELRVQPYRSWFLDNFAWPYPEPSERLRLLAQVPSHGRAQLSNWFVNLRRRSGWSRLAKKYTDGNRDAFAAFLRKVDAGNATEEEVEDVEKCRAHFMNKGNMLVRDGIEEVLTAASKGALKNGCVPPSKRIRSQLFPIKIEDPGKDALSKKRGRLEDVEDTPSSPCSKRSTSGPWTDSSGVLSNDAAETSAGSTAEITTPRRKSTRVRRLPTPTAVRLIPMPRPSTPTHRAPVTPGRLPQSPHLRSFSSPLSSPTAGCFTRSRSTYRAVSSFTIEQPNLTGELALPPPPIQITSNEHFVTLATEPWSNMSPWLNFEVDLNAI